MALKPTVFVGVGTSGTKALIYLRRLLFETYERPGLPIFRFVSLETSQKVTGDDPDLPAENLRDYERIQMLHMTVTNTQAIKQGKLNPKSDDYIPGLDEWMPREILDIPGNQYTTGANHIRSAGRLCLWHNWNAIAAGLRDAYNAVTGPDNISAATQFLNEFYARRHVAEVPSPLVVSGACDVYLVGSLCGGTGGGIMLDVAYFFRSLFANDTIATGGANLKNVFGIFTLLDTQLCTVPGRNLHASNCWASLRELDFFTQKGSQFKAEFPNKTLIETNDTPFDYTMLVTPTNKGGDRFVNQSGQFDEEGLNHMIALKLFAETIAEVKNAQEDVRTNYKTGGFGDSNQNHHARALASFGMSAVLYPKYRITAAAGCVLGQNLMRRWAGNTERVDTVKVRRDATRCWDDLLQAARAEFTRTSQGTSLRADIENLFAGRRAELMALDSGQLEVTLRGSFPSQREPFGHKMATDGEYFRLIQGRASSFGRELRERLDQIVEKTLTEYGDIAESMAFIGEMVSLVKANAESCPPKSPDFSTNSLDFSGLHRAEKDTWTRLLGLRERAVMQHKERVINSLQAHVLAHLASLRNCYARPHLESLVEYMQNDKMGQLRRIREKIESESLPTLERQYQMLANPAVTLNVRPLYRSGSMEKDVEELAERVQHLPAEDYKQLMESIRGGEPLLRLLGRDSNDLVQKVKGVFQSRALTLINNFNVASEMMDRLGEEQVMQLALRSRPYVQYTPTYIPAPLPSGLSNLLIGNSADGAQERLREQLNRNGQDFKTIVSPVEHILMFYREEAGFAIDEMAASTGFKSHHDSIPATLKDYLAGRYTHKEGASHFDITRVDFARQRQQTRRQIHQWQTVALDLLPGDFRDANGHFIFEFQDKSGILQFADMSDEKFMDTLTAGDDNAGAEQFVVRVRGRLAELGKEEVTARVNRLLQAIRAANRTRELTEKSELYRQLVAGMSTAAASAQLRNPHPQSVDVMRLDALLN